MTTPTGPWKRRGMTIGGVLIVISAVTAFGFVVHSVPAEERSGPGDEPLVVSTQVVLWQDGYTVQRQFLGRLEARQESDLGFELAGKVARVFVEEGQIIETGDEVAMLDSDRLQAQRDELIAARDEAQARLNLADLTLNRLREALELNATNRREFDDAEQNRAAAAAALQRADSAVGSIDIDISKMTIRSPFDAIVGARYVDAGRVLAPGTPVVSLLERGNPEARIGIAGSSVDVVSIGQTVSVDVGGSDVVGTVTSILPTRDRAGRAVDVIVRLNAELTSFRRGDLARLEVERDVDSRGFWVPMQALTEGTRGLWSLYALSDDVQPRLLQSDVELLHVEADRAFVRGALVDGQRFVSTGLHRVVPGMTIRRDDAEIAE
ncbi:MAG: efflux RND transporter periplasmic adaptor subunit [Planctomycetota bacterium]